jgi:hypothetical protein
VVTPPVVCPRPGPHGPGPDCPLYSARERIALQRAIEADGAARLSMGVLVWSDFNRRYQRPDALPTRPTRTTIDPLVALTAPVELAEPVVEKGVPSHA